MTDVQISYSTFRHERDKDPVRVREPWKDLANKLKAHPTRPRKLRCPAFSGAIYTPGSTRAKNNVQEMTLAILDFDAGDPDKVCTTLSNCGWEAVVVSSYSYTAEEPRFRVVLPPSRPILPEEWQAVFCAMTQHFPNMIDATSKDVAHLYFWPCKAKPDAQTFFRHVEGMPFDVEGLVALGAAETAIAVHPKNSTADRLSTRAMADHAFESIFSREIWFYRQLFRTYEKGYWRAVPKQDEILIEQLLLGEFEDATVNQLSDAVKTLKILSAFSPDMPDKPELKLCLLNGVLDPVTGQLSAHNPDDRLTFGLAIEWDPSATAPRFQQFLEEIWGTEPDFPERVAFLQQWFGYLLYPSCKFERFLWLEGRGSNGKSVLLKVMAALVGQENVSHAMLERLGTSSVRAELEGKLLNISSEMNANSTMADGYLKQITSGEAIEADRKFRDSVSFTTHVKLVASTNTLPRLLDRSEGFARRATILSFNQQFAEGKRDLNLADTILNTELAGILVWAVEGLETLLSQNRFTVPASSEQAVKAYRTESDAVAMFLEEHLRICPKGTPVDTLFKSFRVFAHQSGFALCNIGEFGRRLSALGVGKRQSNGKVYRLVELEPGAAKKLSFDEAQF